MILNERLLKHTLCALAVVNICLQNAMQMYDIHGIFRPLPEGGLFKVSMFLVLGLVTVGIFGFVDN